MYLKWLKRRWFFSQLNHSSSLIQASFDRNSRSCSEMLMKTNIAFFRDMLEEISELSLTASWKKIRSQIKDDPRYAKFSSSDRVSISFDLGQLQLKNTHFALFVVVVVVLISEMWKRIQWIYERQNGSCQSRFPWTSEGNLYTPSILVEHW